MSDTVEAISGTEIPPKRDSPTEFARKLALAYATRQTAAKVESLELKQATVGDLKGQFIIEGLAIVRDPDDTLDGHMQKAALSAFAAFKLVAALNDPTVREELARAGVKDALVALRNPEKVTT